MRHNTQTWYVSSGLTAPVQRWMVEEAVSGHQMPGRPGRTRGREWCSSFRHTSVRTLTPALSRSELPGVRPTDVHDPVPNQTVAWRTRSPSLCLYPASTALTQALPNPASATTATHRQQVEHLEPGSPVAHISDKIDTLPLPARTPRRLTTTVVPSHECNARHILEGKEKFIVGCRIHTRGPLHQENLSHHAGGTQKLKNRIRLQVLGSVRHPRRVLRC